MKVRTFFIFYVIIAIFHYLLFSETAFAYSSADVPLHHWSYEAVEKLAMEGLLGLSGLDTRPMTRVQMAYKIKEAVDNIEGESLPLHLVLDREHIEYLQTILYKLIDEFRQELVLIGVTTVQIKGEETQSRVGKFFNYNAASALKTENRYVRKKSKTDILLENENGLMLEEGYNLRTRISPWVNVFNLLTASATPAFRLTEHSTELYLDEAAGKASLFNIEIAAQKSAMWWGPGYHGSMLLSNNAKPLNLVRARSIQPFQLPWVFKNLGFFGANFFISKLEKDRAIGEPAFSGLRLEWSPLPYISFGASRTAIMGGKGRPGPDLKDYIKIFFARSKDEFTSAASEVKSSDSDQLASLDLKIVLPLRPESRIASGLEAYGEWAGEDRFSFWENESPGFLMGFFLTDILRDKGTDLRVEYAKNKPAWYNHGIYNAAGTGTAYTYEGAIMGHNMGSDADDLFFRISKELTFLSTPYFDTVKAGAQLDFERHGLSLSVMEKKTEFAADILWTHAGEVGLSLAYELENYKNFQFTSGKSSKNHIVLLKADIKF